jgi:carboxylesterase type B
MQRIPADLLVSGFGTGLTGFITMFGGFGPIVDDKVVFDNYHARAAAGMIAQVPYLGGHTDREAGIVSAITFAVMKGLAEGDGLLAGVAGTIKGALDSLRYSSAVETVGNYLGPLLSGAVGCAMRDAMDARYNSKVPVWRYLYQAAFPNTELYPDTGAYHGIDVPAVFGTTERSLRKIKDTPEEAKFVQNIMHAWATFAKDPERGLDGIGWKQYHPKGEFESNKCGYGANCLRPNAGQTWSSK